MSVLEVLVPGLFSTVQDHGRWGYQSQGLRVQGVMDPFAYAVGNALVKNPPDAAVLETTVAGPRLLARQDMVIAVTGGDMSPTVGGHPIPMWQSLFVPKGSEIAFGALRHGCRSFLAVAGGVNVPPVLGSRSTCLVGGIGGLEGRMLRTGDLLPVGEPSAALGELVGLELVPAARPRFEAEIVLRVVLGPQEDAFTAEAIATLFSATYRVSKDADRMGYRLEGPKLEHVGAADIYSEPISWGALQVPASGNPIILLAGRQGVGGYAKVAGVIAADLPLIAQAKPGDRIRFRQVTLQEAHVALAEQHRWLGPEGIRPVPLGSPGAVSELMRAMTRWGLTYLSVKNSAVDLEVGQQTARQRKQPWQRGWQR